MSISAAAFEAEYMPPPAITGNADGRIPITEVFTMMDPFPPALAAMAGICMNRVVTTYVELGRQALLVAEQDVCIRVDLAMHQVLHSRQGGSLLSSDSCVT